MPSAFIRTSTPEATTGFQGFVYDRTSYGGSSPWPADPGIAYMHIEARQVLPQLLQAAGIEDCILIGHSDGGSIALIYAGGDPEPLHAVVTMAAHVYAEPFSIESIAKAKNGVIEAIASEKQLKKQLDDNRRMAEEWYRKAEDALTHGKEEMARAALLRKKEYDDICKALEPSWQTAQHTSEMLKNQLQPTKFLTVIKLETQMEMRILDEQITSGDDIDTAPRNVNSLRLRRTGDLLDAELEWLWVGAYWANAANTARYGGHDVGNFRLALTPAKHWTLALRVTNLLDVAYADRADFAFGDYRYFPGRGRAYFVEVGWQKD